MTGRLDIPRVLYQVDNGPRFVSEHSLDGMGHPNRLMKPAEVVMGKVKSHGGLVAKEFFLEYAPICFVVRKVSALHAKNKVLSS